MKVLPSMQSELSACERAMRLMRNKVSRAALHDPLRRRPSETQITDSATGNALEAQLLLGRLKDHRRELRSLSGALGEDSSLAFAASPSPSRSPSPEPKPKHVRAPAPAVDLVVLLATTACNAAAARDMALPFDVETLCARVRGALSVHSQPEGVAVNTSNGAPATRHAACLKRGLSRSRNSDL